MERIKKLRLASQRVRDHDPNPLSPAAKAQARTCELPPVGTPDVSAGSRVAAVGVAVVARAVAVGGVAVGGMVGVGWGVAAIVVGAPIRIAVVAIIGGDDR